SCKARRSSGSVAHSGPAAHRAVASTCSTGGGSATTARYRPGAPAASRRSSYQSAATADAASAYRSTRSGRCAARAPVLGPGASAMSSPHRSASSRYATATISRSVRSRVATSSGDATFAGLRLDLEAAADQSQCDPHQLATVNGDAVHDNGMVSRAEQTLTIDPHIVRHDHRFARRISDRPLAPLDDFDDGSARF